MHASRKHAQRERERERESKSNEQRLLDQIIQM